MAAFIAAVALSFSTWFAIHQREHRLAEQEFNARASSHALILQAGINKHIHDVSALRAMFQSSEREIGRREFQTFSDDLLRQQPAILGVSWIPRVTRDQRAAHELAAARDDLPGYRIKSIAADGKLFPAPDAKEFFPVLYTSREKPGSPVYGLDLNDGGIRQHTLERARDGDLAAASPNFILHSGDGDRNGFFVTLPVYQSGQPHDNLDHRQRNLKGFVQGVFQTGVMIDAILANATMPGGLDVYIFAADAADGTSLLYFHPSRARSTPSTPQPRVTIEAGLHWSVDLNVGDGRWQLIAAPIPGGPGTADHLGSWMILLGGLVASIIVSAYFWSAGRHAERLRLGNRRLDQVNGALDVANARLLAQNARFDTALNNMSHGLCFFDGTQRLIVCNRRYIEMYDLPPHRVHPGITLVEIVDLRFEAGSFPPMTKEEYLNWRNSIVVADETRDTVVELKNGRTFRICHRPMPDRGWVATHEDITEQRRAEKAIADAQATAERARQEAQTAHARLLEAFEVVPEGLALMDADDRFVLWNSRYAELYAGTADIIAAGMRFEDLLRVGLARGAYADAIGREEEWLATRLAHHALPSNTHEQRLPPDRWVRAHERRTSDGGTIGVRIDITELKQREESFRLLFDSNPVPMWVLELETLKFLAVNAATLAHYGYSHDEFLQMTALDIRSAQDRDLFNDFIEGGGTSQGHKTWRHRKADGTTILVSVYSDNLTYAGRPARLCAAVDITESARAKESLLEQKLQMDTAIGNMSQGLLLFDSEARLVLCNERYLEMYNLSPDVVKPGCTLRQLIEHRKEVGLFLGDPEQYCRDILVCAATGTTWSLPIELSDGRSIHCVNRPMPGGGWVATHEDITERKQAQARIEYLAHHDPLTDLPNRAAFNDHLVKALAKAAENDEKLAVVCIDLDRFKEVNDVFGHAAGDGLLRELSRRMRDAAAGAFLARLGGDEFSLVLTGGIQPAAAEQLTERLQAVAADDIVVDGHALRSGLSIGVAIYPNDGADPATLLANADAGLYRAKREGRGSVRFFEAEMDQRLRERRTLQHDLRSAIEHHELRLHYQPQASIAGAIIGFEALARWRHPVRGEVSPSVFVPLAEDSGIIIQIGEWVLREACREAASWDRPLQVAINLSPVQFQHGDLPALVHTVLLESGLSPSRLELEITETVLVDDFERAVSILRRLKALGVRIAMDDFGSGYSSLSYLQAFPFDKIKIDQAFIANLDKNPQSAAIIRAVIGLGRSLSLPVMAEGVETQEQLAFLSNEACDEVQGYLIGMPGPIEEYADVTGNTPAHRREILRAV